MARSSSLSSSCRRLGAWPSRLRWLPNRAALDGQIFPPGRHERGFKAQGTADDNELGSPQARCIEIGAEPAPGRRAFAAQVRMDGRPNLWFEAWD